MPYTIRVLPTAQQTIADLSVTNAGKHKKVLKTLALLQNDPRHSSLHTHEYTTLKGPNQEKVFEAYIENKTPSAYRLFFYYGPRKGEIIVIAITPHP